MLIKGPRTTNEITGEMERFDDGYRARREAAETVRCCHCETQFAMVRGSGIKRGYCQQCKAVTCGRHTCDVCKPFEQRMEELQGGKSKLII